MQHYYTQAAMRRFYDSDRAWRAPTDADKIRAKARLLAAVFAAVRAHYPRDARAIAACAWQVHPLAALWRHPRLGWRTRALMVDMGLLLPLPPHVMAALRALMVDMGLLLPLPPHVMAALRALTSQEDACDA